MGDLVKHRSRVGVNLYLSKVKATLTSTSSSILVPIVSAVVGALVAISTVTITVQNQHNEAAIDRRSQAYATYLGEIADFSKFAWAASAWAGTGAPAKAPSNLDGFWKNAQTLQVRLESDYYKALLVTRDPKDGEIGRQLERIRDLQQGVFLDFKCGADLQEVCPGRKRSMTNAEIRNLLLTWSSKFESARVAFTDSASKELS